MCVRRTWRVASGVRVPVPGISETEGKENGKGVAARRCPKPASAEATVGLIEEGTTLSAIAPRKRRFIPNAA